MASFDNLQWTLVAEDKVSGTFQKVALSARDLSKASDQVAASSQGVNLSWLEMAKGVTAGLAVWSAAKAAFSLFTDQLKLSVTEAMSAQGEIARLTALTSNAAGATREQVQALVDQANALERVGVVSAGAIITAQGQLATFDLTTEAIGNLTPALLDMAVAEYGAHVGADQLKSTANGLGKALQGQTKLLTDMGFQFDEATKQMLETGTEAERVTAITEILNSTYEGLNETVADTAEGRLVRLNNSLDAVRETIGTMLLPTLNILVDDLIDTSGKVQVTDDQMAKWQRGIFETFGAIKTIIQIIGGFVGVMGALAKVFVKGVQIVLAWGTDVVRAVANVGKNVSTVFQAIKQGITGDFGGALETMKGLAASVFKTTIDYGGQLGNAFVDVGSAVTAGMNNARSAVSRFAYDRSTFDEMAKSMRDTAGAATGVGGGTEEGMGRAAEAADKAKDKIEDAMTKMTDKYEDARGKIGEALSDLEEQHSDSVGKIKDKLLDLQSTLSDTMAEYDKTMRGMNRSEAERVVAQEENIADIKKRLEEATADLAASTSTEETDLADKRGNISAIEAQLALEEKAYNEYIQNRVGLEAELEEARRRAGETSFERDIEDINARRAEETLAFQAHVAEIQAEVQAQEDALAEEQAIYDAKKAMYAAVDLAFQEFHDSYLANLAGMKDYTAEAVTQMEGELARMVELFNQIKELKSATAVQSVSLPGGAASTTAGGATTTDQSVTTQVTNSFTIKVEGDKAAATTIVAEIQRQLELVNLGSS